MNVTHSSIEGCTVICPFKNHGSIDRTEYDSGKRSKSGSEGQMHTMRSYMESKNGWFHRGRENKWFLETREGGGRQDGGRLGDSYHHAVPHEGQV